LDKVHGNLKIIKGEAKKIAQKQDDIGKKVKDVSQAASKTEKKLDKANTQIKDLLEKLGHDNICINIVFVVIILGLIAVLYGVIKSKLDNPTNQKPTNSTSTTKFFY